MSKSAIKTLIKAEAIISTAGIALDLVSYLNDGKARVGFDGKKLWRNADKLAALILDSVANAFQCENSTNFASSMFTDMEDAADRYIMSNLDSWSQVELEDCRGFFDADHMARLAEMVAANIAFEEREEAHAEAVEINERRRVADFFAGLDAAGCVEKLEETHTEALKMDSQLHQEEFFNASAMMRGVWINLNHAEALEMDQAIHYRKEQAALTDRVREIMGKPVAKADEKELAAAYEKNIDEAKAINLDFDAFAARFAEFWASNVTDEDRAAIVSRDHDFAIQMEEDISQLAQNLADRRCYWMTAEAVAMRQQDQIQQYIRKAQQRPVIIPQHIVKVTVLARQRAMTLKGHLENRPISLAKAGLSEPGFDLPF